MGLVQRAAAWLVGKSDSDAANPQQWLLDWFRGGGEAVTSGVVVTPETAMRLGAVFTCVRIRSEDIGKLPCIMYGGCRRRQKARDHHPLFALIRDRPNPYQTASEFKQLLQAWVDLRGNGYALKEVDGRGRIVALWPVNPTWVTVLHVPDTGSSSIGSHIRTAARSPIRPKRSCICAA
jgi:phage portal protein BeeE